MIVSLLAAVADNGVIGVENRLPWRLPADLQRFKTLTMGRTIIMGRKTFESIGRALPGRRTIVLSRQGTAVGDVEAAASLDAALALAEGEDEVFVVGGAAVYREALAEADRVYLTRIHAEVEGDVRFPAWDVQRWRLAWEERHPADERHDFRFTFQRWERRPRP